MKLYRWHSEALKNYKSGYILAVGANVEDARKSARLHFGKVAADRWSWLFEELPGFELDEYDVAERDEKLALLEKDIAAEPEEAEVFFINGSE